MADPRSLLADLPSPDERARAVVRARAADVLRPTGALRRLDDVAAWLAAWQRTRTPAVTRPAAIVFVADHGVAAEHVSAYPSEVTRSMHEALTAGVATASILARAVDASLSVVDVGVGEPTGNIVLTAALTPDRFARSFERGRAEVRGVRADLLVLGEMGIGNTTAAAAVASALFGMPAVEWTGRGTGVSGAAYERKVATVDRARNRIAGISDPFEILRQVGGAEMVAIAGAMVEARRRSIPVVLDGFVVTAAAAVLEAAVPGSLQHCLAGHCSSEPGHRLLLEKLSMEPLLDLDLRLGEGSGALLALPLVRMAASCVTDVATFGEFGLTR